jgi:hypothetical protein
VLQIHSEQRDYDVGKKLPVGEMPMSCCQFAHKGRGEPFFDVIVNTEHEHRVIQCQAENEKEVRIESSVNN